MSRLDILVVAVFFQGETSYFSAALVIKKRERDSDNVYHLHVSLGVSRNSSEGTLKVPRSPPPQKLEM